MSGDRSSLGDRITVKVWDVPVRAFHWTLVALAALSVSTGYLAGNAMRWHVWSGCAILALLVFRVLWGFIGSTYARFAHFVRGPRAVRDYARGLLSRAPSYTVGHNPLGGWMVVLLLVSLAVQVGTGLFANDDIATEGPLYPLVSKALSDTLSAIHQANVVVLLALIGVHVTAVLYYFFYKGENLVAAMITGTKQVPARALSPAGFPGLARAAVAAIVAAAALYAILNF
jgi:cytochrome b